MFEIKTFSLGSIATNAIVVANTTSQKLWLFDAPMNVDEVLADYNGYSMEALLLTHGHYDHILGWEQIKGQFKQVFGSSLDKDFFVTPQCMAPWMHPAEAAFLRSVEITDWVDGGERFDLNGLQVEVRPSPGHSKGGLIFVLPEHNVAIAGDTIFREGVGRYDLPGASWEELENSIKTQVYTLPDTMTLYPGHGPKTSVGHEKTNNPYVQA